MAGSVYYKCHSFRYQWEREKTLKIVEQYIVFNFDKEWTIVSYLSVANVRNQTESAVLS